MRGAPSHQGLLPALTEEVAPNERMRGCDDLVDRCSHDDLSVGEHCNAVA